ncbi:MAG TPA: hypothetical protein VK699_14720 [Terriglobales bacterium]|jgi:hypothetical protein|nr:hypothetical protein [Terriglobales bacterium]
MKISWLITILVVVTMTTLALAQADDSNPTSSADVTAIAPDNPAADAGPVLQPQEALNAYQKQMVLVTVQTYGELAQIAEAARASQISSEQAEYLTRRSYAIGMIRFQFFDTLYQITETNLSKGSTPEKTDQQIPADQTSNETLVVVPPGSSPDIPESLAKYLELTPIQIAAIQARVVEEQKQIRPLLQQLSQNREALTTAIHVKQSGNSNRQIQQLALAQSHILERIILASSRLQRDIYKTLTAAQREKLDDSGQHIADAFEQRLAER